MQSKLNKQLNIPVQTKTYIQVGVTIPRSPDGKYLPSVPLYIEAENLQRSGLTAAHEKALTDIAGFFIEKYNERLKANKQAQALDGEAVEGAV